MGKTHTMQKHTKHDKTNAGRSYGWRRQLPDKRDVLYEPPAHEPTEASMDLARRFMPDVYNQGTLGSCTANAIAAGFEFCEAKQGYGERFTPSRLFIYYNERKMEGTTSSDSGAEIRDGIKSLNVNGVCPEAEWPYDEATFTQQPDERCYRDALKERCLQYRKVPQQITALKHAMATEKLPVVFGFTVYESFESETVKETGVMPMPQPDEKVLGGHAVMAVGFDDEKEAVLVRNSWGASWGQDGYFWMPYEFISDSDMADDFWMVQTIDAERHAPPVDGDLHYSAHFPALPKTKPATVPETGAQTAELALCGAFSGKGVECHAGRKTKITWRSSRVPRVTVQFCNHTWSGMLSSWTTAAESIENTGCFVWTVPEDAATDNRYWLRVSAADNSALYSDSEYFSVIGDSCHC